MPRFEIEIVPALSDNYIYIAHDPQTGATAVVDPAEAQPVLDALARRGWTPTHILNTHHHADHTAGNAEIKERFGLPSVGPRADAARIPDRDVAVGDGDTWTVGSQTAQVFDTPGHTSGHISFWFPDSDALFCGDTLFALGCGRMFEGTPEGFWNSLLKLRALPDSAQVYCGHEYTQSNARFAVTVEPDNAELAARARQIDAMRAEKRRTVPSGLGEEKRTNPFLRADLPEVQAAVGMPGADPSAVFGEIRRRKDSF